MNSTGFTGQFREGFGIFFWVLNGLFIYFVLGWVFFCLFETRRIKFDCVTVF